MDIRRRTPALALTVAAALLGGTILVPRALRAQQQSADHRMNDLHPSQLAALRGATARFHRLEVALDEGYTAFGGCFADPAGSGAMGYHYVNNSLVEDPAIDPLRPELLVYEKRANGEMQLVAVEWITFVSAWHGAGNVNAPALFGHDFHINPNLLEEPFYLMHAWVWKHNPAGMLKDWNPTVRCR